MKKTLFILSFLFVFGLSAQDNNDCFVQKKRSVKLMKKLNQNLPHYSFSDVKNVLKGIEEKEGVSPQIYDMYALIYWLKEDVLKSREYAKKCLNLCPEKFSTSNYIMGMIYFQLRDYQLCVDYIEKASEIGLKNRFKEDAAITLENSRILAQIMRDTVPYNPEIVKGVSTEADEYLPLISPDQELALYTRRGLRDEYGVIDKKSEDFVFSEGSMEAFNEGEEMAYPFNQNNNEGGATITIDNKILYFTICSQFYTSYNNCDIYYVEKDKDGEWSDLKPMKSINNPKSWESQPSISSDGTTLVFASDRRGGFGGIDLYIVKKDEFGYWGVPQNMGETINSTLNEKSPFFHVDGETMYFASQQFPSLGGYDIFISKLGDDNKWKKPHNLGYPINTEDDELGMFVTTDGQTAYFCSNKLDGVGGWDLYSFDLYDKVKPERVLFIRGDIKDSKGILVDSVSLELKNITTNETTKISVNGGKYVSALTLEDSDDVLITFNKDGYAFNSHYISSTDESFSGPAKMDVEINKLESGKTFELNNIYFATDSFNINKVTKSILTEFSNYLKENSHLKLLISGHTDDVGNKEDNLILSTNRARSVYNFLVESGVDESRLSYKGFGEDRPIYDNSTRKGRAKNRRTECTIVN
ncbi:MAG: hypothetical protein CMD22_03865 [Flavobacteriales bacterium]|mgnify:CR=1 FL=1|nr:hypothetical protein [Flavobacteriales bacterium]|tara:strand:+ start:1296 stop:3218 length:1923 start_codon:yes stop_codon:yes gene_type:complete